MGKSLVIFGWLLAAAAGAQGLPPSFEAWEGGGFVFREGNRCLVLTADSLRMARGNASERPGSLRWLGANPRCKPKGLGLLKGVSHYFIGNQPARWRSRRHYGRVIYRGLYPGVDMVFHPAAGRKGLEFDLVMAPGTDPGVARLRVQGSGLSLAPPVFFQTMAGGRKQVRGKVKTGAGGEMTFEVEGRDPRLALVVDPAVTLSGNLSGSGEDEALALAVDAKGGLVLAGRTQSVDLPLAAAWQGRNRTGGPQPGGDGFIARLDPSGSELIWATYFGGQGDDAMTALALDMAGNVCVTGTTDSADLPVADAVQAARASGTSGRTAFVARFNEAGDKLLSSTYLGGGGSDEGRGLGLDGQGNIYVAGETTSPGFPMVAPFQPAMGGGKDVFLVKLDSNAAAILYSTFLGGGGAEELGGLAVAADGSVVLAGSTQSVNFPLARPRQSGLRGRQDAFLVRFDPAGSALMFSTYLGGSGDERASSVALDGAGRTYAAGWTTSPDFPLQDPWRRTFGGGTRWGDGFISCLAADGSALVYSTFLGASGEDAARAVAVDSDGQAAVAGVTTSADFPVLNPVQGRPAGGPGFQDAFVVKMARGGRSAVFSTYYGGSGDDAANALALDPAGSVCAAGQSGSRDLPLTQDSFNSGDPGTAGGSGAFFVKMNAWVPSTTPTAWRTPSASTTPTLAPATPAPTLTATPAATATATE